MNLPSDPIVLTCLTGLEFGMSNWIMALYPSVESFDTNSNSVKLKFRIENSNNW